MGGGGPPSLKRNYNSLSITTFKDTPRYCSTSSLISIDRYNYFKPLLLWNGKSYNKNAKIKLINILNIRAYLISLRLKFTVI